MTTNAEANETFLNTVLATARQMISEGLPARDMVRCGHIAERLQEPVGRVATALMELDRSGSLHVTRSAPPETIEIRLP